MEANSNEKKSKLSRPSNRALLAVKKDTKKRVFQEVAKANKKDFGRKVRSDELLNLAVSLVTDAHIKELQEKSLSNADRLDREFKKYVDSNGVISKDEYIGKLMRGEIQLGDNKVKAPN